MEIFLKLHPHSISYLYSIQTDKQTESLNGWLSEEAHAYLEPSLSGKCMGLVVRVADIKKMKKKSTFLSMHYRIIYSTNMFHRRVTHSDRKRVAEREKSCSRNCYTHYHFLTRLESSMTADL